MIIEVLVSALILVMVSLAVFATLEKADDAAGTQQRRSLAANFAQSELERIRSLPVEDIAALAGTRIVTRDGIDYTYNVVAKWVTDGDDEPQCTSRTGGLDYMRITVKISWEGMGKSQPISFTSLFTPSAGAGGDNGSVSVRLINRLGGPVAGVGITLDGPSTYSATTNKNGCVVFGFVPASLDYTVKFSRAGYVNADSVNQVEEAVTVTAKETTKLEYVYDSGGFTNAKFRTYKDGQANSGPEPDIDQLVPTRPAAFQMFHAEQNTPGKTITLSGNTDQWNGFSNGPNPTPWFPFTTPYAIYAGNCPKNAPPSSSLMAVGVNIAPLVNQGSDWIRMPAVSVVVRSGSQASPGGAQTDAKVTYDAACGVLWNRDVDSNGKVVDAGVPWVNAPATLKVCAFTGTVNNGKKLVYQLPITPNVRWQQITLYANGGTNNTSQNRGTATTCFA